MCQVRGHSCAQASVRSVVSTALPGKSVAAGIHEEGKKEAVGNHKRGQGVCVYYCSTYYKAQYAQCFLCMNTKVSIPMLCLLPPGLLL